MVSVNTRQTAHWLSHLPQSLQGLKAVDDRWQRLRQGNLTSPTAVTTASEALSTVDWDVVSVEAPWGL